MTTAAKMVRAMRNLRSLDKRKANSRRARRKHYWVLRFNSLLR